jgi:hypothetical protein
MIAMKVTSNDPGDVCGAAKFHHIAFTAKRPRGQRDKNTQ